jgi:hypothetical protein
MKKRPIQWLLRCANPIIVKIAGAGAKSWRGRLWGSMKNIANSLTCGSMSDVAIACR